MKIILKKWNLKNFFRFLFLTINRGYSEEFSRNFIGYLFYQGIKNIFIKNKDYKFAVYVNNSFAGSVALYYKKEGYELGYFILKGFGGKGIAGKSAKKMLNFGFNKLKLNKVIATTDLDNKASNKILRKLGFKLKKKDKKDKEVLWEKRK